MITVLHDRLALVAPIDGVSVAVENDKSGWRVDFKPEATPAQRAAAQAVVDAFDVAAAEQKLKDAEQAEKDKRTSLLSQPNKSITVQDLIDLGLL